MKMIHQSIHQTQNDSLKPSENHFFWQCQGASFMFLLQVQWRIHAHATRPHDGRGTKSELYIAAIRQKQHSMIRKLVLFKFM